VPDQWIALLHPFLDEHLHEGTGFRRTFPRQGAFASGQLDDHIADPARFARFHQQVLGQIVTLVEQAQRRHPVFQRRANPALNRAVGNWGGSKRFGHIGGDRLCGIVRLARTGGEREQSSQQKRPPHLHASCEVTPSGDQAS
jgi:hypothetical protein